MNQKVKLFAIFTNIIVFILAHYFIVLSASMAGAISLFLLDMIAIWKLKKKALLAIPIVFFVAFIVFTDRFVSQDNFSEIRIVKRFVDSDFSALLAKRTEGRFFLENLSIVFGNGKTKPTIGKNEVHNTFIDIIYSYGVIGGGLFSIFLILYLKHCMFVRYHIPILLAFIPMNISHNLFRFRMFWIFLALIYSISVIRSERAQIEHTS